MNIYNNSKTSISIVSRGFDSSVTVNITMDGTNENQSFASSMVIDGNYEDLSLVGFTYSLNTFYNLEVVNSSDEVIFKGKLFTTDQDPSTYTINKDKYKEANSQLDTKSKYIIYGK